MHNIEYTRNDHSITLTGYHGQDTRLTIPSHLDDRPVTTIGAKAFLSCKTITELELPDTVRHLGDWAFAHMKQLRTLTLSAHSYTLGKDVFLDCPSLQEIRLLNDTSNNPALPGLLASVITTLKQPSLFRPQDAGQSASHPMWLTEYDEALTTFISAPDDHGFQPVFYGWFNDEDAETTQRPAYIAARQTAKIKLAFLRLYSPCLLNPSVRDCLYTCLGKNIEATENKASDSPVWKLYCEEYIQDIRYAHILAESGSITPSNLPGLLPDISAKNPEAAAFFLSRTQSPDPLQNFFEDFTL